LCGALNTAGDCCGLGLIERIDFTRAGLTLYTPARGAEIRALQFGDLYLKLDGYQLGRKQPGLF